MLSRLPMIILQNSSSLPQGTLEGGFQLDSWVGWQVPCQKTIRLALIHFLVGYLDISWGIASKGAKMMALIIVHKHIVVALSWMIMLTFIFVNWKCRFGHWDPVKSNGWTMCYAGIISPKIISYSLMLTLPNWSCSLDLSVLGRS